MGKARKLFEQVRNYVDENAGSLSQKEYLEFLEELVDDFSIRIETVKDEIKEGADR